MSDTVRTLTIESMTRRDSSRNGNPRFSVTFTNGLVASTEVDSGFAYAIENPEYRGVPLEVHFDGRGNITRAEVA